MVKPDAEMLLLIWYLIKNNQQINADIPLVWLLFQARQTRRLNSIDLPYWQTNKYWAGAELVATLKVAICLYRVYWLKSVSINCEGNIYVHVAFNADMQTVPLCFFLT